MRVFKFVHLFWILFNQNQKPNLKKIERKGLLAVKIGQMYALRSDFLSIEKCRHLSKLYESASHIASQNIQQLFEEHASQKLKDDLKKIDEKPLASASIGQVHMATLKSGKRVVLKIVKDDFKDDFLKDTDSALKIIKAISFFYPKIKKVADPIGTLETIKRLTLTELDLTNEIEGIEKLQSLKNKHISKLPYLQKLSFPHIYEDLSNKKVLVSDFVDGKSFRALLDEETLSYEKLLQLFRIHGFYLFLLGKFHGDLHPGNIFLDGEQIIFLDNANIENVPTRFSQGIVQLLFHLAEAEWKQGAQVLHDISKLKISEKKYLKFEEKFLGLYKNFDQKKVSEISLTNQMMQTVKLAIHSGMEFEEGMFGVIKTLMYLDGMVLKCNPDAVLLKDVARFKSDFE